MGIQASISDYSVIDNLYSDENLQAALSAKPFSAASNQLKEDNWTFNYNRPKTFHFEVFKQFNDLFTSRTLRTNRGAIIKLDLVHLIKVLFIKLDINSLNTGDSLYVGLLSMLSFMKQSNQTCIKQENIEDYFEYLLMHTVDTKINTVTKRLSPLSFASFKKGYYQFDVQLNRTLKELYLDEFIIKKPLTKNRKNKALTNVIDRLSDGELTLAEYKEGKSFNYLTLDHGRYYVDYCHQYFQRHKVVAQALVHTQLEFDNILKCTNRSQNADNLTMCRKLLSGWALEEVKKQSGTKHSLDRLRTLKCKIFSVYKKHFRKISIMAELKTDEGINSIIGNLKLSLAPESIERLKAIVTAHLSDRTTVFVKKLLGSSDFNLDIAELINAIEKARTEISERLNITVPSVEYFDKAGAEVDSKTLQITSFIHNVESAGNTIFVAYTGWRESEFGFGLNDIQISENLDVLDQYYHPLRYQVKWVISKTNGETKLDREITQDAYYVAEQLAAIVNANSTFPSCLYGSRDRYNGKVVNSDSAHAIRIRTFALWSMFTSDYEAFIALDGLEKIKELNATKAVQPLSHIEMKEYMALCEQSVREKWESYSEDYLLVATKERVRTELPRVMLAYTLNKYGLMAYKCGTLDRQSAALIDECLDEQAKDQINELSSEEEISSTLVRHVCQALRANCIYPTPHAFRHMWAEAVFRRFEGDIGLMIRSNFKHISQTMWLAYIRNKTNENLHRGVKRKVISSLVNKFEFQQSKGFGGLLSKWMRRVSKNTKVVSLSDSKALDAVAHAFALEQFEDIKSNAWGYCLLRRRYKERAKCAEDGVPQRHNASPFMCLWCPNNFIESGHAFGIVMNISNDLEALKAPIPESFKTSPRKTVINARKRLKEINAKQQYIAAIDEALNIDEKLRMTA